MGYIQFCDKCGSQEADLEKLWIGDEQVPPKYKSINILCSKDICASCKSATVREIEAIFKFRRS